VNPSCSLWSESRLDEKALALLGCARAPFCTGQLAVKTDARTIAHKRSEWLVGGFCCSKIVRRVAETRRRHKQSFPTAQSLSAELLPCFPPRRPSLVLRLMVHLHFHHFPESTPIRTPQPPARILGRTLDETRQNFGLCARPLPHQDKTLRRRNSLPCSASEQMFWTQPANQVLQSSPTAGAGRSIT
jgi:hypothetical protein